MNFVYLVKNFRIKKHYILASFLVQAIQAFVNAVLEPQSCRLGQCELHEYRALSVIVEVQLG